MNGLLKYVLLLFYSIVFQTAYAQLENVSTLKQYYSLGSYSDFYGYSCPEIKSLNIQIDKETLEFLKAHKDYSIADFPNLEIVEITEARISYSSYEGYPSLFISNLNGEDIEVFQNWLNEIDKLDSLSKLTIPSFFNIKPIKSLETLDLLHYNYIHNSIYENQSQVTHLGIRSNEQDLQSIGFNFKYFDDLSKLTLAFFSENIASVQLPNLEHCNKLKVTSVFFQKGKNVTFSGHIYGNTFAIYGDSLKSLLFSEVSAVDKLNFFEFSGMQLNNYNFSGLTFNSQNLECNLYLNSIDLFDFSKLPQNTKYEKLTINGHSLTEIKFPENSITINNLSIVSESLVILSPGITSIIELKKVIFNTPKLEFIAEDLYALNTLEYLDINQSNLERIPVDIENMSNCNYLMMNINNIYRSDLKRLGKLKSLGEIYISESKPHSIKSLKRKKSKEKFLKRQFNNYEVEVLISEY